MKNPITQIDKILALFERTKAALEKAVDTALAERAVLQAKVVALSSAEAKARRAIEGLDKLLKGE